MLSIGIILTTLKTSLYYSIDSNTEARTSVSSAQDSEVILNDGGGFGGGPARGPLSLRRCYILLHESIHHKGSHNRPWIFTEFPWDEVNPSWRVQCELFNEASTPTSDFRFDTRYLVST